MARRSAVPKTLIRTVVDDAMKDAVIAAIIESARSAGLGEIGDGKIFVTPVLDAVRVRTGEKGSAAI